MTAGSGGAGGAGDADGAGGSGRADGSDGSEASVASLGSVVQPYVIAIDHVGIAVADLDAAKTWYLEHLGFPCVHEEVNEEQGVREAMLAVGDSGSAVQLLAPLSRDTTIGRFLESRGPGVQQVAYRVVDLDALCAELRARGTRLLYDQPRRGTAGSRVNFIHPKDAGGVLVELVEPASDEEESGQHGP